jgi:hypothetical protein
VYYRLAAFCALVLVRVSVAVTRACVVYGPGGGERGGGGAERRREQTRQPTAALCMEVSGLRRPAVQAHWACSAHHLLPGAMET